MELTRAEVVEALSASNTSTPSVELKKVRIRAQRDLIYGRWIVRAISRTRFSQTKQVSVVALQEELMEDVTAAAGWRGGAELFRCARNAVRDAIEGLSGGGPVDTIAEYDPTPIHFPNEYPAIQALIGELLLSGRGRQCVSAELRNLPRCPDITPGTDAPSVTAHDAEESPSVADSAASSIVGMLP